MILREICNNNTAVELKEIAKNNGLSGYSKMKKAELVELVSDHLGNYDTIEDTLLLASDLELNCFEKICKGEVDTLPEDAKDYVFFFMRGYLNINNKREVSVADDVKRLFPVIYGTQLQEKRAKFQGMLDYCRAGVNLYGRVPVDFIVNYYNNNNRDNITKEELLVVVRKAQTRNCIIELRDDEFIHELLMTNENAYETLKQRQGDKPFYTPDKNEFLNYADDEYVANDEHYEQFKNFFMNLCVMTEESAKSAVSEVECLYGEGLDADHILVELEKLGLTYTDDYHRQLCLNATLNYTNHIRLWENRGNTKAELGIGINATNVLNFTPSTQTVKRTEKKVGRNEPCPCGSGKKYKFCCGRN